MLQRDGVEGVTKCKLKKKEKKVVGTVGTIKSSDHFHARLQPGAEH